MPSSKENEDTFTSLAEGSTDSAAVKKYYDNWAKDYDQTLDDWEYRTPADAAALICPQLSTGSRILDVGCGTGLFSAEVRQRIEAEFHGVDISDASLAISEKRGCYRDLTQHDLQNLPLPFEDNSFDGIGCVGVLTYIEDIGGLMKDFCRIVGSGGHIVFTQRDDRWAEKEFDAHIARLKYADIWTPLHISEPKPYLPRNKDFADEIKVIHVLCRVR